MHVPKHRLIPVKISMSYGNIKTMAARKKVKTNIKGCWMRVKGKFRCDISSSMASPAQEIDNSNTSVRGTKRKKKNAKGKGIKSRKRKK